MLIVGGLIALAIVALLAAFFLARGDGNGKDTAATKPDAVPSKDTVRLADTASTVRPSPSRPSEDGRSAGSQLQPQPQTPPSLQGQLHELAEQIQMLQGQSREMEQRLQHISVVLNRLDQLDRDEPVPDAPATTTVWNTPRA